MFFRSRNFLLWYNNFYTRIFPITFPSYTYIHPPINSELITKAPSIFISQCGVKHKAGSCIYGYQQTKNVAKLEQYVFLSRDCFWCLKRCADQHHGCGKLTTEKKFEIMKIWASFLKLSYG